MVTQCYSCMRFCRSVIGLVEGGKLAFLCGENKRHGLGQNKNVPVPLVFTANVWIECHRFGIGQHELVWSWNGEGPLPSLANPPIPTPVYGWPSREDWEVIQKERARKAQERGRSA